MANSLTRRGRDGSRRHRRLVAGAALASLAVLTTAYGAGAGNASATTLQRKATTPPAARIATARHGQTPAPGTITTVKTRFGMVLADFRGRTLYMLTADKNGKSSCSSACLGVWPAATGTPHRGKGVTAKLGTTERQGGGRIITADGHPLYIYTGDTVKGQTRGQGINTFGGRWYVLSPAGKPLTKPPSSPSPSPAPPGGGY